MSRIRRGLSSGKFNSSMQRRAISDWMVMMREFSVYLLASLSESGVVRGRDATRPRYGVTARLRFRSVKQHNSPR